MKIPAAILLATALPLAALESAPPHTLWAGHAVADISPGPGLTPFGYDFRGERTTPGHAGVHDPLRFRVLVLGDAAHSDQTLVLASFDLAVLPDELVAAWRPLIAKNARTSPERVILAATHTHSAPFPDLTEKEGPYLTKIRDAVMDAVARAEGLRFPVRPWFQAAPLGLGYDRRVKTSDGVQLNWNPQEYPDRPPQAAVDPTCSLLEFRQDNGPRRILLWSHGTHPVVLGKTSAVMSADFPGRACDLIGDFLPETRAMFFMGASAHSQPWIATQENPARIEPVARAAASFVSLLAEGARPLAPGPLRMAGGTVETGAGPLELSVVRIGELRVMAVPVELFEELALDLRRRAKGPVFLITLANGWHGYLPHRAAFEEGRYEVDDARRQGYRPGDGEALVDALLRLDERLDR
jgi:hypothetical protein